MIHKSNFSREIYCFTIIIKRQVKLLKFQISINNSAHQLSEMSKCQGYSCKKWTENKRKGILFCFMF